MLAPSRQACCSRSLWTYLQRCGRLAVRFSGKLAEFAHACQGGGGFLGCRSHNESLRRTRRLPEQQRDRCVLRIEQTSDFCAPQEERMAAAGFHWAVTFRLSQTRLCQHGARRCPKRRLLSPAPAPVLIANSRYRQPAPAELLRDSCYQKKRAPRLVTYICRP